MTVAGFVPAAGSRPLRERTGNDGSAVAVDPSAMAKRYAPLLVFDDDEKFWPADVPQYLRLSVLRFQNGSCASEWEGIDPVLIGVNAGKDAYSYDADSPSDGCRKVEPPVYANQVTKPYLDASERVRRLGKKMGFVLDVDDLYHHGNLSNGHYYGAPIYYEFSQRGATAWLRYWFFYACSTIPVNNLRGTCIHESDWEGIALVFRRRSGTLTPAAAFYYAHHAGNYVHWHNVIRSDGAGQISRSGTLGTHPVVFVARGTHASYPGAGAWPAPPSADTPRGNGYRWLTWRSRRGIRDAALEPWYGYGGAWGAPARGALEHARAKDAYGPVGPGQPIRSEGKPAPFAFAPVAYPNGWNSWCDPAYDPKYNKDPRRKRYCIRPLSGHDLNCKHLPASYRDFPVIRRPNSSGYLDVHNLDSDNNNIGCETKKKKTPPPDATKYAQNFTGVVLPDDCLATATMDWGDGGRQAKGPEPFAQIRQEIFAHAYSTPGIYHVVFTHSVTRPSYVCGYGGVGADGPFKTEVKKFRIRCQDGGCGPIKPARGQYDEYVLKDPFRP